MAEIERQMTSAEESLSSMCNNLTEKPDWFKDCAVARNIVFRRTDVKPPYKATSLYDLVRYIRNRKVHCWETKKMSATEKEYYAALGGYWKFYSKHFLNYWFSCSNT